MTQVPASSHGGGFTPITCVLSVPTLNVASAADHPIKWTALHDNLWDFGVLAALPSGLGVTASFDGTLADIVTTLAGTWAFAFYVETSTSGDATWLGEFQDGLWAKADLGKFVLGAAAEAPRAALSYVLPLPSGATLQPEIATTQAATGAMTANVQCVVTRLA